MSCYNKRPFEISYNKTILTDILFSIGAGTEWNDNLDIIAKGQGFELLVVGGGLREEYVVRDHMAINNFCVDKIRPSSWLWIEIW